MKVSIAILTFLFCVSTINSQKKIEVSDLPSAASQFLKRHFANEVIKKVKQRRKHGQRGYEVYLTNGTQIGFWKDGKWREVHGHKKPIPTDFIDERIRNYVAENYPESKITHIDYGNNDIRVDVTGKSNLKFTKGDIVIKPK